MNIYVDTRQVKKQHFAGTRSPMCFPRSQLLGKHYPEMTMSLLFFVLPPMCTMTQVLFSVALSSLAICLRADSSHAEARTSQVYVNCGSRALRIKVVKDTGQGRARNQARMRHLLQPIPKGALEYEYTTALVPPRYCDGKSVRSLWPGCAGGRDP